MVVQVVRSSGPLYRVPLRPTWQQYGAWGELRVKPAWAPQWVGSPHPYAAVRFYPRLNVYAFYLRACAVRL